MSTDPFAGILDPFAWWDISAAYDKYASFFDLVVYCTIFVALAHVVFSSRFPGRAGKALATAMGIGLGVSLAIVETQVGWSLRKAGPIAALLGLLLVGFLILHTLVRVHVSWMLAVPLSYVIVYLFIRAVSPKLMDLITATVPFVHLLAAVMFLVCVWRIGVLLWPSVSGVVAASGSDARFLAGLDHKRESDELKLIQKLQHHMAPEAKRQAARLAHSLDAVRKELGRDRPDWEAVTQTVSHLTRDADSTAAIIDRIRVLDQRIQNFDWQELRQLTSYYRELSDQDKQRLKEQILFERRKIVQEHAVEQLTTACELRHKELRQGLNTITQAAALRDKQGALDGVATAVRIEDQQREDISKLLTAEKKLKALARQKLRDEKHV